MKVFFLFKFVGRAMTSEVVQPMVEIEKVAFAFFAFCIALGKVGVECVSSLA